jgi:cyanate permease
MRMFGGGGSAMDLTAVLTFIAFSIVYLLVPLIGGHNRRPMALLTSLYMLIGYGGVSLIQTLVMWMQSLDRNGFGRGEGMHLYFGFTVLKMALFLIAMVVFVNGLRAVRLRGDEEE